MQEVYEEQLNNQTSCQLSERCNSSRVGDHFRSNFKLDLFVYLDLVAMKLGYYGFGFKPSVCVFLKKHQSVSWQ